MNIRPAVAQPISTIGSGSAERARRYGLWIAARRDASVLLLVCLFGLLYESHFLFRGWIPHDEGALAESASRVLGGQLPHRDFEEIYTGGLSYLHALTFILFGEKLASMRLLLFAFFSAWIPVLYAIARRFASPLVAGACVVACVAWSVPNYSASMPSWYNLFFATFALALLFRYFDTRRNRWLLGVGIACGLSVTVKQTGIYAVLAVFLVLLFDAQVRSEYDPGGRRVLSLGFVVACATAMVGFLVFLLHRRLGPAEAVSFLVPGSCLAALLIWNEELAARLRASVRLRSLLSPSLSFGVGLALPIGLFVSPYVASGSLGSLVHGVLIEPSARLRFAAMSPPALWVLPIAFLVLLALVGLGRALSSTRLRVRLAGVGVLLTWFASTETARAYGITWLAVREASLFVLPVGVVLLAVSMRRRTTSSVANLQTLALLAFFAFATLTQFPFSAPIYFCYVAPLMFLALLALQAHWREAGRAALSPAAVGTLFLFLAVFGIARVNQEFLGGRTWIAQGAPLGLARSGSLRVSPSDSQLYRRLIARIDATGARSSYIYAGPDAPELYFLADRRNPTRTEFEFFDRGPAQDRELLRALDRRGVSIIALNLRPTFSPPLDPHLRAVLALRYPHRERYGRFELRWRA